MAVAVKRIPISTAREYATANGQVAVVIFSWEEGGRSHVVTHGRSEEECAAAAKWGNELKERLGWPEDLRAEPPLVKRLHEAIARQRQVLDRVVSANQSLLMALHLDKSDAELHAALDALDDALGAAGEELDGKPRADRRA